MAPKRILVVGAGAAGMSCADTLANHEDRFKVTLIDAVDYCGGQAFSIPISESTHGASWLNQGVQGGSHIFKHTIRNIKKNGHEVSPVKLTVSFGKGDTFWTNLFPTPLVARHQKEIAKFTRLLTVIRWLEVLFMFIPLKMTLKLFWFSDDFVNYMILPTIALFLGTGNATPDVPTIILERIFTSPTYGMWYPPDPKSLASNEPPMIVFSELSRLYSDWERDLRHRGVEIRLSTELVQVMERSSTGVKVRLSRRNGANATVDTVEAFDDMVLCCLADTSKRVLGQQATWLEKKILGSAKFSDDLTVTHCDAEYMKKRYTTAFDHNQAVTQLGSESQQHRIDHAREAFNPMYYIVAQNEEENHDATKLDMCFDCTNYQAQFKSGADLPFDNHVFQTIFLNKKDERYWTRDQIAKSKIIREDWWHQLEHSWSGWFHSKDSYLTLTVWPAKTAHYVLVVPWLWLLQGTKSVHYAAAWTLVNCHEVAVMSGTSAAVDLGASYPSDLAQDKFALLCFRLYNLVVYGKWYTMARLTRGKTRTA